VKAHAENLDVKTIEALDSAYGKVQSAQAILQGSISKSIETPRETEPLSEQLETAPLDEETSDCEKAEVTSPIPKEAKADAPVTPEPATETVTEPRRSAVSTPSDLVPAPSQSTTTSGASSSRPSLAESEFSWMLGDHAHRSSFVSSASVPPDQSRRSESSSRPSPLFGEGREDGRKGRGDEDDGLALSSLPREYG
jgi:TBC1 domain family protein 5